MFDASIIVVAAAPSIGWLIIRGGDRVAQARSKPIVLIPEVAAANSAGELPAKHVGVALCLLSVIIKPAQPDARTRPANVSRPSFNERPELTRRGAGGGT